MSPFQITSFCQWLSETKCVQNKTSCVYSYVSSKIIFSWEIKLIIETAERQTMKYFLTLRILRIGKKMEFIILTLFSFPRKAKVVPAHMAENNTVQANWTRRYGTEISFQGVNLVRLFRKMTSYFYKVFCHFKFFSLMLRIRVFVKTNRFSYVQQRNKRE